MERNHILFVIALATIIFAAYALFANEDADAANQHDNMLMSNDHGSAMTVGELSTKDFDSQEYLTTWNFNNLPENEREKFYKETELPDGTKMREYWIYAEDKKIEVAPNVFYEAWAYNSQVPGPTIRATEGDTVRIYFFNKGSHPHTMHFHGFHPAGMDGAELQDFVDTGESFTYEFKAAPYGTHLYHCHSLPLKKHLEKGLYGAYIVDQKNDTRPKADKEFIMIMNAFDTNFDGENEIYAVNTIPFAYVKNPIKVRVGELVRIHIINLVENDPLNSIHIHGNFFDEYPTGTLEKPSEYTDIIELGQGERSMIDVRFNSPGKFMFHAHQTEFAEKGWVGMFEVIE